MDGLFSIFVFFIVVTRSNAACLHGNMCMESRDTIKYDANQEDALGRTHRTWTIEPIQSKGNILLIFKNFYVTDEGGVTVTYYSDNGRQESKSYSGDLNNFEELLTNTWLILINATVDIDTSFTLHYYADCDIARQSPIQNRRGVQESNIKCYIIISETTTSIGRTYFYIRNLIMAEGLKLKVNDVHLAQNIISLDKNVDYEGVFSESNISLDGQSSFFVVVDFMCSTTNCNYKNKSYLISYYVMNEEETSCIEATSSCMYNNSHGSSCNLRCSGMIDIVLNEARLEGDPMSELEEEMNGNVVVRRSTYLIENRYFDNNCPFITPQTPRPLRCRCHLPRDDTEERIRFCPNRFKCLKILYCRWRCMYAKFKCSKKSAHQLLVNLQ